jgi:hypothetical protein
MDRGACFSSCSECDVDRLGSVRFFPIFKPIWVANRFVWCSCEAMAESLSVAISAVSSAKVAVVDSVEVGRPAMCRRYNNGSGTVLWGTLALTGEMHRKMHFQQFFCCCLCIRLPR